MLRGWLREFRRATSRDADYFSSQIVVVEFFSMDDDNKR